MRGARFLVPEGRRRIARVCSLAHPGISLNVFCSLAVATADLPKKFAECGLDIFDFRDVTR